MKILAISHSALLNVNQFLYEELIRRGHDVTLIVPKNWGSGGLGKNHTWQENEKLQLIPCDTYFTGNGSLYFLKESLGKLFEKLRPDVLFLDEEPWSLVALQSLVALRKFSNIRLVTYTKQNIYKKYPLPFRLIEKWAYRRSESFLSIGQECTEVLRLKGYSGPICIFPHAVDLELFAYEPRPISTKDVLKLGYMGRFVAAKGGEELIKAVGLLIQKSKNVQLTFIGGGEAEKEWRELVKKLNLESYVFFSSSLPHLEAPRGYRSFDIVCLPSRTTPSWKEQFGRVIIEAAAIGRPVIGSDSGEIPHVIRSLENGVIFKEADCESLAQAIEKLMANPSLIDQLSSTGRKKVEELYSYEAIGDVFCNNLMR